MWELDSKNGRALKNWCLQTLVLEKTLESPFDCKEIKPIIPKGNQPWIFIGRTDAESPIFLPPDVKDQLVSKDPDAGKDWRQRRRGRQRMRWVAWHLWLDGHEFEQAPGVGDGQGGLACCNPWGRKESDMTDPLNWTSRKVMGLKPLLPLLPHPPREEVPSLLLYQGSYFTNIMPVYFSFPLETIFSFFKK